MPNRTDSMLSKGMGKLKEMKAVVTGLVGVFRVLAEQHGEVSALLDRGKSSDEKFTELWPTIKRELLSHERAELQEIYPVMRANAQLVALAEHHEAEAGELEELIREIDRFAVGAGERRRLYAELVEMVKHHATEEEGDIFPKAQDVLGKPRIEALEPPFVAAKSQIAASIPLMA